MYPQVYPQVPVFLPEITAGGCIFLKFLRLTPKYGEGKQINLVWTVSPAAARGPKLPSRRSRPAVPRGKPRLQWLCHVADPQLRPCHITPRALHGHTAASSFVAEQQRCNIDATEVQQRCNRDATKVQQRCNRDATEMQQSCNSWCNRGATKVQQRCNRAATAGATEVQQRCNRDATEMQQRSNSVDAGKAPCVLNGGGGGGGGGGGWAADGWMVVEGGVGGEGRCRQDMPL